MYLLVFIFLVMLLLMPTFCRHSGRFCHSQSNKHAFDIQRTVHRDIFLFDIQRTVHRDIFLFDIQRTVHRDIFLQ
jgi:hypothetical protein